MTTDRIIELLRDSAADAWAVTDTRTEGWEFYFIRHRLDQNRVRDVEHIEVTVYRKLEDGKLLGSASGEIAPTASEEETGRELATFCGRAAFVKNPYYELNKPVKQAVEAASTDKVTGRAPEAESSGELTGQMPEKTPDVEVTGRVPETESFVEPAGQMPETPSAGMDSELASGNAVLPSVDRISRDFIEALRQVPETATEDINSYEIFVERCERRFVNSEGIDVTERYPASAVEVVVNARPAPEDVEIMAGACPPCEEAAGARESGSPPCEEATGARGSGNPPCEEATGARGSGSPPCEEATGARGSGSPPCEEATGARGSGNPPCEEAAGARGSGSPPCEEATGARESGNPPCAERTGPQGSACPPGNEEQESAGVQAPKAGHREIELYRMFTSGTCDREALVRDIGEVLRYGRDRLTARPTPALKKASVIFSTGDAVRIYRWFAAKLDVAQKYRGFSDWEIGKPVSGEWKGDRITLTALRFLPNSSRNRRFDAEGAPVWDLTLLEDGVPAHFHGSRQFRYYLNTEAASSAEDVQTADDGFIATNFSVSGGTKTAEELRQGPYLEAIEFSDFSVDEVTGDIAGELRLAYWHNGDSVIPVTGGSISGNMRDFVMSMACSKEQRCYDNWLIPALTLLRDVNVAGVERNGGLL